MSFIVAEQPEIECQLLEMWISLLLYAQLSRIHIRIHCSWIFGLKALLRTVTQLSKNLIAKNLFLWDAWHCWIHFLAYYCVSFYIILNFCSTLFYFKVLLGWGSTFWYLYWAQKHGFHPPNSPVYYYAFILFILSVPSSWFHISVLLKLKQNVGPFPCAAPSVGEDCRLKSLPLGALTRLFSTARQGDSLHTFSFMALSLFIITQLQFY